MKVIKSLSVLVLLFFAIPYLVGAGDYHKDDTLRCTDCHTMHFSEENVQAKINLIGTDVPALSGGPNSHLLRQPLADICLACHNGRTFAPDVKGANVNDYIRAGGAITDGSAEYQYANGHTMGYTGATPFGDWSVSEQGLQCNDCHSTHGNGSYRNLTTKPGNSTNITVTYRTGAYDPLNNNEAVQEAATSPMSARYAVSNIKYRRYLEGSNYGLSKWCAGCHDSYLGSGTQGCRFDDPPDTMYTYYGGSGRWFNAAIKSRVPVVSPGNNIPGDPPSTSDNRPFCGTCHKAHGSTHADGLIWDNRLTSVIEDGADMNDTCYQCHN
ncbi:MAG: hypothetical protein A2073_01205 [Deltaproteobacteria bacterium GWC2_42_11]|nr:MAG: hypothetical protein A2073_01205 [Deltaproteobacteria bacterium GWC2_42_11]HBO84839.1 hypothetical protein [Deltaproteobacteria bacterium]